MRAKRIRGLWLRRLHTGRWESGRLWLPLLLGLVMAFGLLRWFDASLRPQVVALSQTQIQNHLTQVADQALLRALADPELFHEGMVKGQTQEGLSTLVTDTAALNRLRGAILEDVISEISDLDDRFLNVPLGALTGLDLLSAAGPQLPVRILSAASAQGEYRNEFISAGINQTLHRIMLDISVTAKLLLPGGVVEVPVSAPICISETIIVGQVPQTYLNWSQ